MSSTMIPLQHPPLVDVLDNRKPVDAPCPSTNARMDAALELVAAWLAERRDEEGLIAMALQCRDWLGIAAAQRWSTLDNANMAKLIRLLLDAERNGSLEPSARAALYVSMVKTIDISASLAFQGFEGRLLLPSTVYGRMFPRLESIRVRVNLPADLRLAAMWTTPSVTEIHLHADIHGSADDWKHSFSFFLSELYLSCESLQRLTVHGLLPMQGHIPEALAGVVLFKLRTLRSLEIESISLTEEMLHALPRCSQLEKLTVDGVGPFLDVARSQVTSPDHSNLHLSMTLRGQVTTLLSMMEAMTVHPVALELVCYVNGPSMYYVGQLPWTATSVFRGLKSFTLRYRVDGPAPPKRPLRWMDFDHSLTHAEHLEQLTIDYQELPGMELGDAQMCEFLNRMPLLRTFTCLWRHNPPTSGVRREGSVLTWLGMINLAYYSASLDSIYVGHVDLCDMSDRIPIIPRGGRAVHVRAKTATTTSCFRTAMVLLPTPPYITLQVDDPEVATIVRQALDYIQNHYEDDGMAPGWDEYY